MGLLTEADQHANAAADDLVRVALIVPDGELMERLQREIEARPAFRLTRKATEYLNELEAARFLRAAFPSIVLISMHDSTAALKLAREIRRVMPHVQMVGVGSVPEPDLMREAMRSGMRDWVSETGDGEQLVHAMQCALDHLRLDQSAPRVRQSDLLVSFVPAKPGVGSSTTALNVALVLAARAEHRVLLADFDLSLGVLGFMLKLDRIPSAHEAAQMAPRMDEDMWDQLIVSRNQLDVLGSGLVDPTERVETGQVRDLISFCRRLYGTIVVDHSGHMEPYSMELLAESKQIYLVTTPEMAPLHLARMKLILFDALGLGDRVRVIVNRTSRSDAITTDDVATLLSREVHMSLPNDYQRVNDAMKVGTGVGGESQLGAMYAALAGEVTTTKPVVKPRRKFLEYLGLRS